MENYIYKRFSAKQTERYNDTNIPYRRPGTDALTHKMMFLQSVGKIHISADKFIFSLL